jgi:predicted O-linked N-acetylglucosamine transferase (SPINDLY family)
MSSTVLDDALEAYRAGDFHDAVHIIALALEEEDAPRMGLLALLGNVQLKLGDRAKAADAFVAAAQDPSGNRAILLKHAVTLYMQINRLDAVLALGAQAGELNPDDKAFLFALARVFVDRGGPDHRDDCRALLARLDWSDTKHVFLAVNHYRTTGGLVEMTAVLNAARALKPHDPVIENFSFVMSFDSYDLEAKDRHAALMLTPDDPFTREVMNSEQAFARIIASEDEALHSLPNIDALRLKRIIAPIKSQRRQIRPEGDRLRIGYLSSDFSGHATMTLLLDTLLAHDRDRFEITLFCYTPAAHAADQAKLPERLRAEIVSVRAMTDAEAAAEISRRGIDLLIDLKGHTQNARLGIVNLSDAPVKATYLGFPGPVAGADLDYAIVDKIVAPLASAPYYTEKFCWMPETYQANSRASRPQPSGAVRADHGLPENAFVYASFNSGYKLSRQSLDIWARVLMAAPQSVFWTLCSAPTQQDILSRALAERGVDPGRLIFAANLDYPQHVSRLPLADLALDSFPCNGHTTTSDMLWAGLPVLTKKGGAFVSRVSESLLRAIDLPELVADDGDDFVARAAALAGDPERLAAIKARLGANRQTSALFDPERFARHLETGYEMMAARERAGLAADHITVPKRDT